MCIYGVQMQRLEEHSADAGEGAVGFRTVSDGGGVFYSVCSPGKKHPIKDTKELLGRYLYVWIIQDDLDDLQMMDAGTY